MNLVKPDEALARCLVMASGQWNQGFAAACGMPDKRVWAVTEKWERKGWWDCYRLTEKGFYALFEWLALEGYSSLCGSIPYEHYVSIFQSLSKRGFVNEYGPRAR